MSSTFNFKGVEEKNPIGALLAPTMLTFIPLGGGKDSVQAGERITLNNATNEPLFICLALAAGLKADTPAIFSKLVQGFMIARIGHNLAFANMRNGMIAGLRTTFWCMGMGCTLTMAGMLLMN